ncbi:MAG: hypothetical protein CMJ59_15000 [Planctomycetaceae bacterium]|nr:hypothetical protein [Planctomycetaceae bacterium]
MQSFDVPSEIGTLAELFAPNIFENTVRIVRLNASEARFIVSFLETGPERTHENRCRIDVLWKIPDKKVPFVLMVGLWGVHLPNALHHSDRVFSAVSPALLRRQTVPVVCGIDGFSLALLYHCHSGSEVRNLFLLQLYQRHDDVDFRPRICQILLL